MFKCKFCNIALPTLQIRMDHERDNVCVDEVRHVNRSLRALRITLLTRVSRMAIRLMRWCAVIRSRLETRQRAACAAMIELLFMTIDAKNMRWRDIRAANVTRFSGENGIWTTISAQSCASWYA